MANDFEKYLEEHSDLEAKINEPSPEQQKIADLRKEFNEIKAGTKIISQKAESLNANLLQNGDPRDKEYAELYKKVQTLILEASKSGEEENKKESQIALQNLLNDIKKEIPRMSHEQVKMMKIISNREFLALPEEKRLQYITKDNVDAESVASGDIKNITFNFTFDGKFNKNLYMLTTAGQVLPKEVREVIKDGVKYERSGLKGEFYAGNKRLVIKDGTNINISRIGNKEELQKIDAENQKIYNKFLEDNNEFKDETKYGNTVKEAIDKGITKDNELKYLLTGKTEFLKDSKVEELDKLLIISIYLKNAGFLDDAGIDTKDIVSDLKEIINILKTYGKGLKYSIIDNDIKFNLGQNGLPEGIEGEGIGKFIKVALSQLGTSEFIKGDNGADRYLSGYEKGLNSRNTPWCAAFVNRALEHSGYKGTGGLSAKQFIGESGYGHVGIKVGDKLLGGNQGNKVSLVNMRSQPEGYAIPTENGLQIVKPAGKKENIPDGAIVVYGRHVKDKRYS